MMVKINIVVTCQELIDISFPSFIFFILSTVENEVSVNNQRLILHYCQIIS